MLELILRKNVSVIQWLSYKSLRFDILKAALL